MSVTDLEATTGVPVGRVEEIPLGEGRTFVVGGTQVAVFRLRDGSLHATQAACPHAGGPLADGQTDVDVLVCPLHLYAYRDPWGQDAREPATPGQFRSSLPLIPLPKVPVR